MRKNEPETENWQEFGALQRTVVLSVCLSCAQTSAQAQEMECSYDYITHTTTLRLEHMGDTNGSISYSFVHSVSPSGGEEMFLFSESDPAELRGEGRLEFIMSKLHYNPEELPESIEFIDFERPAMKQFQFPSHHLEQAEEMINAPIVAWDCRRID